MDFFGMQEKSQLINHLVINIVYHLFIVESIYFKKRMAIIREYYLRHIPTAHTHKTLCEAMTFRVDDLFPT
jgi:hypothetical protein